MMRTRSILLKKKRSASITAKLALGWSINGNLNQRLATASSFTMQRQKKFSLLSGFHKLSGWHMH